MSRRVADKHLNLSVRGMSVASTLAINEHSEALGAEGEEVYKLGLGQSPFPVPEPVVEALRRNADKSEYLPVRGLYQLRRAIAHYTERTAGIDRTADDVLVGPGAKPLFFLLQLAFFGDLVLPTPSWSSYAAQARILGRRVHWEPTHKDHGWLLTAEQLDRLCATEPERPRIVVLSYPSNPTGASYKVEELKDLAQVAKNRGVWLLSDESYAELHHKGQHVSIARYYPDGTIISSGLSKWCGAGGYRLGTMVFPESMRWLLDAMSAVASETYTSVTTPIQYAAVAAYEPSLEIDRYLAGSRRILAALGRWCARKLRGVRIECPQPSGGYYLFLDFSPHRDALAARDITDSRQLCVRLLAETGVAILAGAEFGQLESELTARLAYVDFDGARALEAVHVIPEEQPLDETFLKRHCGRVVDAVLAVCNWTTR